MGPYCVRWWLIVVVFFALVLGFPGSYSLRGFVKLNSKRYSIEQSQHAISINNVGFVDERIERELDKLHYRGGENNLKVVIASCAHTGDLVLLDELLKRLHRANALTPQLSHIALSLAVKHHLQQERTNTLMDAANAKKLVSILHQLIGWNTPICSSLIEDIFTNVLIPKGHSEDVLSIMQFLLRTDGVAIKSDVLLDMFRTMATTSKPSKLSYLVEYTQLLVNHTTLIRDHRTRTLAVIEHFLRTCAMYGDINTALVIHASAIRGASSALADWYPYVFTAYHTWREELPVDYRVDNRAEWNRIHHMMNTLVIKCVSRGYDQDAAISREIIKFFTVTNHTEHLVWYMARMQNVLQHPLSASSVWYLTKATASSAAHDPPAHRDQPPSSPSSSSLSPMPTLLSVWFMSYLQQQTTNATNIPMCVQHRYPWIYGAMRMKEVDDVPLSLSTRNTAAMEEDEMGALVDEVIGWYHLTNTTNFTVIRNHLGCLNGTTLTDAPMVPYPLPRVTTGSLRKALATALERSLSLSWTTLSETAGLPQFLQGVIARLGHDDQEEEAGVRAASVSVGDTGPPPIATP